MQRLGDADDVFAVGDLGGGKEEESCSTVADGRVVGLGAGDEAVVVLPLERLDHDRIRERHSRDGVVVAQALRPDEGVVAFLLLRPRPLATKDLDEDAAAVSIVPDSMNLVREGEVDGRDFSVLDVAEDVRKRLARRDVDGVESVRRIAGRTDLEALRKALADEFGDEGENVRAFWVVDAKEGRGGNGARWDGVVELGVLVLERFGGREVVGGDGQTSAASKGPAKEGRNGQFGRLELGRRKEKERTSTSLPASSSSSQRSEFPPTSSPDPPTQHSSSPAYSG